MLRVINNFISFYKNAIHARIFRGPPTHMPPMNSNHGGHLPDQETSTVEKKGFQMGPLRYSYRIEAIYTILLKIVYLDHFIPYSFESGKWVQPELVIYITYIIYIQISLNF